MLNFESHFLLFLPFLALLHKNIEQANFDQLLELAAPKCWSKFTTMHSVNHLLSTPKNVGTYDSLLAPFLLVLKQLWHPSTPSSQPPKRAPKNDGNKKSSERVVRMPFKRHCKALCLSGFSFAILKPKRGCIISSWNRLQTCLVK